MADANAAVRGAAAATAREHNSSLMMRIVRNTPYFLWLFLAFVILKLVPEIPFIPDFDWRTAITIGNYGISIVDLFYLGMIVAAIFELDRVSHPGIDNTKEAHRMMTVATILVILFVAGVIINILLGMDLLEPDIWFIEWMSKTFSSTEFMILTVVSRFIHVPLAYLINARTLKRTIDYGASEG